MSTDQSPSEAASPGDLILEQGKVIGGKYVLETPAGLGGMASVWVATNQATGARVCVKILVPEANGEEASERFRREAHTSAKLTHRAIVRVFDLLSLDRAGKITREARPHAYVIVMELLTGESLADRLTKRGKLPLEEALDLFLPVMSALAHAHRASIIHRDLKPANVFLAVDPDGHVAPKVLDFGLAKTWDAEPLTSDGIIVGTPSFMSPEQAKGARYLDARSDVFSAGTLLYMMLSGVNPFEEKSFAQGVEALLRREAPPLGEVPPAIWEVIRRAMKKDPAERFPDATEMGIALRKAAGRRVTTDSQPSLPAFVSPASAPSIAVSDSVPGVVSGRNVSGESSGAVGEPSSPIPVPLAVRRWLVFAGVGVVGLVLVIASVTLLRSGSSSRPEPARPAEPLPLPTPLESKARSPVDPPPPAPPSALPATSAAEPAKSATPAKSGRPVAPKRRPDIVRDPGF
jgi:serine/threonine-protein kinase